MKKLASKVARIQPNFFQYCQPAHKQPKSQFLFHKNCSPRNLCIMTLEAGGDGTLLTDIPLGIGPVLGKCSTYFCI